MTYHERVRAFKRSLLTEAVDEHGSVSAAAKALHMSRSYAQKLCTALDVPRARRHHGNWGDEMRA